MSNPEFKEYRLGDLFEFKAIKQAASQRLIPTDNSEAGIPYVVQSIQNNMISRNVNKQWLIDNKEAPVSGNKIVLGVTLPAVSYQKHEFGASQVITAEAEWLNELVGNYIVTILKGMMYRFSYGSKPGMQIYKDMVIKLPALENGSPDFDYMADYVRKIQADYVRKIQADYVRKIQAYLKVTGLNDTTLTETERGGTIRSFIKEED